MRHAKYVFVYLGPIHDILWVRVNHAKVIIILPAYKGGRNCMIDWYRYAVEFSRVLFTQGNTWLRVQKLQYGICDLANLWLYTLKSFLYNKLKLVVQTHFSDALCNRKISETEEQVAA